MAGAFTFGMEEEYFLVDAETKVVARDVPAEFFDEAKKASEGRISTEFLQPQIEVISSPHVNMADARAELRMLRRTVSNVAARYGLAILAAGTHPTALWREAQQTDKQRYDTVMDDLQMIGQRDLLCGLHVHVELPDPDLRVDVMYRILPYLPLLLALSTSSPFWQARRTGLKGYRLAAYDELPRTGVTRAFSHPAGVRRLHRGAGARRRHQGFELCLVGHPALAQQPDTGAARPRLLHPGRGFACHRRALSHAGPPPPCQPQSQQRSRCGRACDCHRKQVARAALRGARDLRHRGWRRSRSRTCSSE